MPLNNDHSVVFSKVTILESVPFISSEVLGLLRTEVRGDFTIHGTKYFKNGVFHQKSKTQKASNVGIHIWENCSPLWCFKPPVPLVGPKKPSSPWNIDTAGYYWKCLRKVQEAYNIINFWFLMENSILKIFGSVDGKITI